MTHDHDAVVVGGGIAGANCALQLARAGLDDVTILESEEPASKASGRAAGSITTYRHERFGAEASRFGRELYEEFGTAFEIQMLMGVREDAQTELAREYPVYQYVPYGRKWFSYFYRRIRERRRNALFAARALLGR